jgi:hypothetical protein
VLKSYVFLSPSSLFVKFPFREFSKGVDENLSEEKLRAETEPKKKK